jgi:hypothetical protein
MTITLRGAFAALASYALLGCGGGGDGADIDQFVGRWVVTAGTQTVTCTGLPIPPMDLKGTSQQLMKDSATTLSIALLDGCTVKLDVAGSTATVRPNQQCTFNAMFMNTTVPVMGTVTGGKFVITGNTAAFDYAGNAMYGPLMCTLSASGTSMKTAGSPDGGGGGG